MNTRSLILASFATMVLGLTAAQAGPCNTTTGRTAEKDAGSGPTVGSTAQTSAGTAREEKEHPPTSTMNRTTGNVAASSQDSQKQMQGEPTAAQQAESAKTQTADKGC
jgi:hypothetical protein